METFQNRLSDIVRHEGKEARVFLGERLAEAKKDLDKAEKMLVDYKKNKETVSVSSQTNAYLDRQSALLRQISDNQLAVAASQTKLETSSKQMVRQNPGFVADNPLIQQYKSRLAEQEMELAGLRKTLTVNHPRMVTLQATITETRTKLKAEIAKVVNQEAPSSNPVYVQMMQNRVQAETDLAVSRVQKGVLEKLNDEGKRELLLLPAKEQGLARLLLDYSVAESVYTMLGKRYEEARIAEATQPTNVQVVDRAALPDKPVKPRKSLNLTVGAVIGLLGGCIGTFLSEYFYKTIDSAADVKRYLDGVEVIGSVPSYQPLQKGPASFMSKLLGSNGRRVNNG